MSAANKVIREIIGDLENTLNRCGIMYHIFYRIKSPVSIKSKLEKKSEEYIAHNKKMQDFLALRITLYFKDDVELVHNYLKNQPNFNDESVDKEEVERFCPKRLNIVMNIPPKFKEDIRVAINETGYPRLIDETYEIQIRTILSEGWHEVEHDLRYKCKEDWTMFKDEARLLNGIYASLECSEWSMLTLFGNLAYKQYKNKDWNSMLRNKMRIRFTNKELSNEIYEYLSENLDVAKSLYRVNRLNILKLMMDKRLGYPLTYDTVIHLINRIGIKNIGLSKFEDEVLKKDLDILFGDIQSKNIN